MPYKNKAERNAHARRWRRKHPEVSRRWRKNNLLQNRNIQLEDTAKRRYGLTRKEQRVLHEKVCDICGKRAKKMCVDHSVPKTHRGVLCQQCNTRLGWLEKHADVILSYIKRGPCACCITKTSNRHAYRRARARKAIRKK